MKDKEQKKQEGMEFKFPWDEDIEPRVKNIYEDLPPEWVYWVSASILFFGILGFFLLIFFLLGLF